MSLELARMFSIPSRVDPRGHLSFLEIGEHVPFEVQRLYYLYDVKSGESRGSHAHKALEQVFISMSGAFEIELDDGHRKQTFMLDRRDQGLYVPPGLWRDLRGFSSGAVCLVLASLHFSEEDYIRDYAEFKSVYGE